MSHFSAINDVYKTFFGSSPPARACVAVDLPKDINVQLDCIAYAEEAPTDREALHVQGLSYWAPANIGPYSQAIRVYILPIQYCLSVLRYCRRFITGSIFLDRSE